MKKKAQFLFLLFFNFFNVFSQNTPDFEKIDKAVVIIEIYDNKGQLFGHASGFVIDSSGIIVTNNHVIETGGPFKVVFNKNGIKKSYEIESIVSSNPSLDLATVKIAKSNTTEFFDVIKLSKTIPKKGDKCWAIGTPSDPEYMNTISEGIISNIYKKGVANWKGLVFQTTAEITHGSSGGVLINPQGEAIAVTCGGDETSDGARASINWAISSTELKNLNNVNKKVETIKNQDLVSGRVSFYSNSFINGNIDLFVDGIYIGSIKKRINCNNIPECGSEDLINKNISQGKHFYSAYCKKTGELIKGEINISVNNDCKLINIELLKNQKIESNYKIPISIKVNNQIDCEVFLVKYYGKGLYYADTACLINGFVTFEGNKQKPGILALLLPGQKYFEFIYNNEDVQLETQGPEYVESMKIKKSEENIIFYDYMKFLSKKREEANKISEERTKLKKEDSEYKILSDKIDAISKEVISYQKNLIETNKTKLVGKIVKMGMDIDIPAAPKDANGKQIDSLFTYHYYRDHFFDNVDLKDERLVNTPIFHSKVETYFGKTMMIQHWDTIIKYAFEFCDRLDPKSKTFEYCVSWITSTYEKSNIMGMDKVFVMMGDRYYCSKNADGKSPATWVKEDKLKELCEKVNTQKNLVMGVRPPNISLRDTSDAKWFDYYSLKSEYTILYFWDADCGHCKKTTPKMQELYKTKFKDRNIEIFSVCKAIGDDFPKWKTFVKENNLTFINVGVTESLYKAAMEDARQFVPKYTSLDALNYQTTFDIFSTPRIFVLDKDKKIIAKQLSISQLEDMMDKLQHKEDSPKLFPPDPEEDEQMTH